MVSKSLRKRLLSRLAPALVAVLALSAVGAAGASASAPVLEHNFAQFTGKGGAMTLTTKSGGTVSCTANTSAMELNGGSGFRNFQLKLTGCTWSVSGSPACTSSGAAGGEIKSRPLSATLRYAVISGVQKPSLVLQPESGTQVAEFTCASFLGSEKFKVNGAVVGEVSPANTSTTALTVTFRQSGSVQNPADYLAAEGCGAVGTALTATGEGPVPFAAQSAGLEGTNTISASKLVKVAATSCL